MRRFAIVAAAAALCAPRIFAGEGEGGWMTPLWHVPTILWQLLNFALVIILFWYLLRKKAPEFFLGRAASIREALEKAVREKDAALARLREVEAKMARLGQEIEAIEKEALATSESEKARILAEAEAARKRIRSESISELERRVESARRELREYAASLVEAMAREKVAAQLTPEDEVRLADDFFRKLEEKSHDRLG